MEAITSTPLAAYEMGEKAVVLRSTVTLHVDGYDPTGMNEEEVSALLSFPKGCFSWAWMYDVGQEHRAGATYILEVRLRYREFFMETCAAMGHSIEQIAFVYNSPIEFIKSVISQGDTAMKTYGVTETELLVVISKLLVLRESTLSLVQEIKQLGS